MTDPDDASTGYWYPDRTDETTTVDVLNLLRRYREAERSMRARSRASMRMNENDLIAVRFLIEQGRRGRHVVQRDLAAKLDISSASVTALVDRLVRSGHVVRTPHPTDGRAICLRTTTTTDHELRATLGTMHRRMLEVVDGLAPVERDAVARFLAGMIEAVGEQDPPDPVPPTPR